MAQDVPDQALTAIRSARRIGQGFRQALRRPLLAWVDKAIDEIEIVS